MSGVIALQLQTQVADLCLLQGCSDRKCQKFYALSRLVSRLYSNVLYDTMLYTLRYDDLAYFFTLCSTLLIRSPKLETFTSEARVQARRAERTSLMAKARQGLKDSGP